jgi:hypothetical protein
MKTQGGSYRYSCTPSLTFPPDGGCQCHTLTALFCAKIQYTSNMGAGWVLESVWMGVENLARLGFDPWTIHLTVSCYTSHTIMAHGRIVGHLNIR